MGNVMYDPKKDPDYDDGYIDIDEQRVRRLMDGTQIPFRYMHGGFRKKKVKFSFCFPEMENYKGRFLQYLSPFPGPDEEMASYGQEGGVGDKVGFALENGAYFVESNMGSAHMFGPVPDPERTWKSSAAVAEYSREKAMEIYHCERPTGVVYGGSGGGYKTMACIENTRAWDGAAPYVIGSPASLPNTITLHAQGQRALRHCFGKIVDALDAGGSGDMYAGLTPYEQKMLREVTEMGFPPKAWFREAGGTINDGALPVIMPLIKEEDPEYFKDFWTVPGYAGFDAMGDARRDRLHFETTVEAVRLPDEPGDEETDTRNGVDNAWKKLLTDGNGAWIKVKELPEGDDLYLGGVSIVPEGDAGRGEALLLDRMIREPGQKGGYLTIGSCYGMDDLSGVLGSLKPGDPVLLDNSDYVAALYYYRYQVPEDLNFHAWDQFRDADGKPVYPQRRFLGKGMTGTGTVQDGNIQGKVIVTQALMDESTCPWCGDWYRSTVREKKGNEDNFRIYYYERCLHGNDWNSDNNMVIDYEGGLRQTILDLFDWIQNRKEPRRSTSYERRGGDIFVTARGAKRNGLQPQVILTANNEKCLHVKAGEEFELETYVEIPEGAGELTHVDYDFQDVWDLPDPNAFPVHGTYKRTLDNGVHGGTSTIRHHYDEPGTHFASVRVTINRQGNENAIFTQVKNLDRVRIIVE